VTRPGAELSRESLAFRIEQLENRSRGESHTVQPPAAKSASTPVAETQPDLDLEQLSNAWRNAVLPAVAERSIPTSSVLGEAKPAALAEDRLVLEFPPAASFHRNLAEEPKNAELLAEVLYEVTGRKLKIEFVVGEGAEEQEQEEAPATEEEIISLMKSTFDAREVDDTQ